MKNIVVLTGAGISAESGIQTFRDADGLWEGYDVMEVASPQGWYKIWTWFLIFTIKEESNCLRLNLIKSHLLLAQLQVKNSY